MLCIGRGCDVLHWSCLYYFVLILVEMLVSIVVLLLCICHNRVMFCIERVRDALSGS